MTPAAKLLARRVRIGKQIPGFEGKPMSNANVAQVQSLYAAFGRGDVATLIAGLSPDVDWETIGRTSDFPTLGPRKGAGAVQEFFKLVADNEEFSDFTPREFYSS